MTDVRDHVRERYARAARSLLAGEQACCGPGPCADSCAPPAASECCGCSDIEPGHEHYTDEDAQGVPAAAVQTSLGCGNPPALARLHPGQVVVDLGSGGGLDAILAARKVGPTGFVYGIDMTPEMLELARANQLRAGLANIAFVQGRIEELPLADAAADVVISNCVINLAPDKDAVLRECYRVLRPGGTIAVSDTVFTAPPPAAAVADADSWARCVAGALMVDDYRAKLANAGFEEIDIQVGGSVSWGPAELASASIRARKPRALPAYGLRPAGPEDMPAVIGLLTSMNLPLAGIDDTDLTVCEVDGAVAAVAGLQWHDREVLLRSVVVSRELRAHGLGRAVVNAVVDQARAHGAKQVFLLTTTARSYFEELGFELVDRAAVPPALHASPELAGACPATADVMRLRLA